MSEIFSFRGQISDVISRLFYYTDHLDWEKLSQKVLAPKVLLDMSSITNGHPETLSAEAICQMFDQNLKNLDAVHHQAGNFIIDIDDNTANVIAYATTTYYTKGENIKEYVGTYFFHLTKLDVGWRIDKYTYKLKYML